MEVFRRGTLVGATERWPWDALLQEAPTLV
jgi:hypothetical protein